MTDPLRPALAAYLATNGIKLVHTWQTLDRWNAMMEWPYDPTLKKPLTTERHATGTGATAPEAVIAGLTRMGFSGFTLRLYIIGRIL